MKSFNYIFVLLLSFLIIQCTNEIPLATNPDNLELGKISLRIDKENAPEAVVLVEAFLTRENHDTLYGVLNLLDSTSADILFEGVAAGDWHLKVDAKDNEGVVLYTGETDLTVLAGILTQVNLTLLPTGHGTGSIYIVVTWGTSITGWTQLQSGTSAFLRDLSFINPNTGWIVGDNSTLLKTTNAGLSWVVQLTGISDDVFCVNFINEHIGWIGTSAGLIYKTTDGGNSWVFQYNASGKWITDIYFISESVGFATIFGYNSSVWQRYGAVIKTTNGGLTWVLKTQIDYTGFQSINFTDDENGYVVGSSGIFSRTTNGGETWSSPLYLTDHWLHTVYFVNKYDGFAAGGNLNSTLIFKTSNGGNNWTLVRNTTEGGIAGLSFLNSEMGWACGYNGTLLKTSNGGSNWEPEISGINSAIGEMIIFNNSGYAAGENGVILKYSH